MSIFQKLESQVRSYALSFPATFDRAIGSEIWTNDDVRYIDFLAGCGALNYGHNNPELKEELINYIANDRMTLGLDLETTAKENFLEALDQNILQPRDLDYRVQFTGPTGANAVEAALKIARKTKDRSNIIFFTNGFHGVSLGAVSTTGNCYHRAGAHIPLNNTTSMPYDGYMGEGVDTVQYIEKLLRDPSSGVDLPAAFIVECVQGEGGLNVASSDWLKSLEQLCKDLDILLIVDDIQAGCGRTGDFFSFEEAGITPDIVTLSKSLSGFGLPFSIVLLKPEIDSWKPGEHNGTFRGNNHAFITSTAMILNYWADDEFSNSVKRKGELISRRMKEIQNYYPLDVTEVKGRGMMQGLSCREPQMAKFIATEAFNQGLIMECSGPHDEVVKCFAPLTIDYKVLDEGLDILADAFHTIFGAANDVEMKLA
jgi:diaminobutyrate-2-oxoglutarate transaminase